MLDCQNLSDECTCEDLEVKTLCKAFYSKVNPSTNYYSLKFDIVCDLNIDLIGGEDEKYCDTKLLYDNSPGLSQKSIKCTMGPTAFNRSMHVLPGEATGKTSKFYNLLLIFNLSVLELIFGFVLIAIGFLSNSYSGNYYSNDFKARSIFVCDF